MLVTESADSSSGDVKSSVATSQKIAKIDLQCVGKPSWCISLVGERDSTGGKGSWLGRLEASPYWRKQTNFLSIERS